MPCLLEAGNVGAGGARGILPRGRFGRDGEMAPVRYTLILSRCLSLSLPLFPPHHCMPVQCGKDSARTSIWVMRAWMAPRCSVNGASVGSTMLCWTRAILVTWGALNCSGAALKR